MFQNTFLIIPLVLFALWIIPIEIQQPNKYILTFSYSFIFFFFCLLHPGHTNILHPTCFVFFSIFFFQKLLNHSDFAEYMDYHHRQLFNEKYRPKGFCHAIRRPQHYPEGTLSLESRNEKGDYRPVPCLVASRSTMGDETSAPPMSFPLNAASNLTVSLIQSAIYKCDTLLIFSISFRYDYSSPVSVVSVSPFIYLHLPKFIFFFWCNIFFEFFF